MLIRSCAYVVKGGGWRGRTAEHFGLGREVDVGGKVWKGMSKMTCCGKMFEMHRWMRRSLESLGPMGTVRGEWLWRWD